MAQAVRVHRRRSSSVRLFGGSSAAFDASLWELASNAAHVEAFAAPSDADPKWRIERVDRLESPDCTLSGSLAPWGFVAVEGRTIRAHIPDDPRAAQSVLRLVYHLEAAERGGLLVHSSAVRIGDSALIAVAPSGSGKSTLARLNCEGGATLLSDEIVAVFPDGTCAGTPFRSDYDRPGAPVSAPISAVLTLRKAGSESMRPLGEAEVMPLLIAQTYRSPYRPLALREVLRRWAQVLAKVPPYELSFRKDPAAATFLREWLRGRPGRTIPGE